MLALLLSALWRRSVKLLAHLFDNESNLVFDVCKRNHFSTFHIFANNFRSSIVDSIKFDFVMLTMRAVDKKFELSQSFLSFKNVYFLSFFKLKLKFLLMRKLFFWSLACHEMRKLNSKTFGEEMRINSLNRFNKSLNWRKQLLGNVPFHIHLFL